ncbi:MAG TPA: TatD family hydrolase [Bacilli bacterium]|nr:TatD family hydrolase [Bacilli bacterium]
MKKTNYESIKDPMIIDTHIHLFDDKYQHQLMEIISQAQAQGVGKMIVVGFDFVSSQKAIALAQQFPFLYASVGLHPSEVHKFPDEELLWVKTLAQNPKVVAIGEIGLDYYWDRTYRLLQQKQFIRQIQIAKELHLPVVIHNREATNDVFQILKQERPQGVLHCYSGSLEMAKEFVKMGLFLGIGGVLTFKNSKEIKKVVSEIDLSHLLSETDGPYLAPTPYRGKLNKPEYLPLIIEAIASLKQLSFATVEKQLQKNAEILFNI